jgi:hypothetical protein
MFLALLYERAISLYIILDSGYRGVVLSRRADNPDKRVH